MRTFLRARPLAAAAGAVAAGAALLVAVPSGGPAAAAAGRVETPLSSRSPVTDVAVSLVTIDAPLPASAGAHPAACDTLSYLRFRHRNGPAASASAARILLAQPGATAGAASMAEIARNTVVNAARAGQFVEYWAIDRRSNCLEDNTGLVAAARRNDPDLALDYYTKGTTVDGRRFAGYVPANRRAFLAKLGMQQTVNDQHTLLTRELPDPALRKAKVWCGGHSLGGVITAFFAMSDFDGNPATKDDAGYNQCAGYFALDTEISTTIGGDTVPMPGEANALLPSGKGVVDAAYAIGLLPTALDLPVVNPETTNLLALAGSYAALRPTGVSTLAREFADNGNVQLALRVLLSREAVNFVLGSPKVADFRFTNQAALGGLMDDNSMPLAVLQQSVGFFTGGKIADKNFPTSNDLQNIPELRGTVGLLLGPDKKAIPDDSGPVWAPGTGPLYSWLNYDQVTAANVPKAKDGRPFTTRADEVTDIGDLARGLSEFPANFIDNYFPLAMMTDTALWSQGERAVVPSAIHTEGIAARPTINLWGDKGLVLVRKPAGQPLPPNTLVLPGYSHLDVLTAARVQNDGSQEKGAQALASFVLSR